MLLNTGDVGIGKLDTIYLVSPLPFIQKLQIFLYNTDKIAWAQNIMDQIRGEIKFLGNVNLFVMS